MPKSKATVLGTVVGAVLGIMVGFVFWIVSPTPEWPGSGVPGSLYLNGGGLIGAVVGALVGWSLGSPKNT